MKRILCSVLTFLLAGMLSVGCAVEEGNEITSQSSYESKESSEAVGSTASEAESVAESEAESDTESDTVSDTVSEDDTAEELKLTLTQTNTVANENFNGLPAFKDFLENSKKFAVIPGLSENTVPQGIGRNPETGYTYISSYFNESGKASVISVLDEKGRFVAEYHVYNKNGTPFTGHMGGICVTEDYIYFSGPSASNYYSVVELALKDLPLKGSHNITIETTVTLPIHSSYLFYDSGILWVGTFYLAGSYDLGKHFNFKTPNSDGTQYGGYAAAFVLDGEEKRPTVKSGENYAVPTFVLATPDKVQGFAYKDGKVCLSKSYGRNNNSTLEYFKIDMAKGDKTITVDGKTYPMTVLDSKNRTKTVTAMGMTEGITLDKNGKIMVLFESAAKKYYNSKNPTDHIWTTEFYGK